MDSFTKLKGTTLKRHEQIMQANHAIERARAVTNAAIGQGADRLGTPGAGREQL